MTFPIHEFSHGGSPYRCSITGGEVYRGAAMPWLHGTYFFADYCSNQIWTLERSGSKVIVTDVTDDLDPPSYSIGSPSGFGLDCKRRDVYLRSRRRGLKVLPGVATGACCVNETVCVTPGRVQLHRWWWHLHWADFVACSSVDCAAACDGDCNGDGSVNVVDLLQLIADYGNASDCDWNGDGIATVEDILSCSVAGDRADLIDV